MGKRFQPTSSAAANKWCCMFMDSASRSMVKNLMEIKTCRHPPKFRLGNVELLR